MIPCTDQALEDRAVALAFHEPSVLGDAFVTPSELTSPRAIVMLRAMMALATRGEPVDNVTLRAESIRLFGRVDDEYLIELAATSPFDFPRGSIAKRLRELATARTLREQVASTLDMIERGDLAPALDRLRQISDTRVPGSDDAQRYAKLSTLLEEGVQELHDIAGRKGQTPLVVESGIAEVDAAIVGFDLSDMVVIAGDTSVGKSSIALMMLIAATRRGHRPGIITFEDGRLRWSRRIIAAITGIPVSAQKRCDLSMTQWTALGNGIDRVKCMGVEIDFAFWEGGSLREGLEAQRKLIRDGCDIILGDYLQAVEDVGGSTRRDDMRLIMSRSRRESARAPHPVLTIWLSQMRKRANEREKPTRADIYEANDIAQKADHILLLWKDERGILNGVIDKTKDEATGLEFIIERDRSTGMLVTHHDGSAS